MADVINISSSGDEEDDKKISKKKSINDSSQKRKANSELQNVTIVKKVKRELVKESEQITNSVIQSSNSVQKVQFVESKSQINEIPQLVVKQVVPISTATNDFTKFLNLCLEVEPTEDMKSVTAKLRKKYMTVDPNYIQSDSFKNLLNKYSKLIEKKVFIYKYLKEVTIELKRRRVKPSCSKVKELENNLSDNDNENGIELSNSDIRKLRKLESVMSQVKKKIEELELAEVDWDDEEDSHYLREDRYKRKYMQQYNEYCRIKKDKGLIVKYLRLKDLESNGMTKISVIDESIIKFVNQNIKKFNNIRVNKPNSIQNVSYVPDYVDILQCITNCDQKHDLNLPTKKIEELARKAFETIVTYLKKQREHENWNAYFSYLEDGSEDPATTNEELMKKLKDNKKIGEEKLNKVFEEFVRKQENLSAEDLEKDKESNEEDGNESNDSTTESIKNDDKSISDHHSGNDDFESESEKKKKMLEKRIEESLKSINESLTNQKESSALKYVDPVIDENQISLNKPEVEDSTKVSKVNNDNKNKIRFENQQEEYSVKPKAIVGEKKLEEKVNKVVKNTDKQEIIKESSNTIRDNDVEIINPKIQAKVSNVIQIKPIKETKDKCSNTFLKVCSFAKPPKSWLSPEKKCSKMINPLAKIVSKNKQVNKQVIQSEPEIINLSDEEGPPSSTVNKKSFGNIKINNKNYKVIPREKTVIVGQLINNYHFKIGEKKKNV